MKVAAARFCGALSKAFMKRRNPECFRSSDEEAANNPSANN